MIYLTIRHNALNFVQCIQNDTPMIPLFFFTFFNKINSIHISDFCDIRIVNIGKQTLKTSTLCMWFGIRIFFSVLRFWKLGKIFKIFNIFSQMYTMKTKVSHFFQIFLLPNDINSPIFFYCLEYIYAPTKCNHFYIPNAWFN
jgi:hypothetical protein